MKWLNHGLIAGAICAVVSPPHVPICVAGATAPDLMASPPYLSED